jgi:hypothetical protein
MDPTKGSETSTNINQMLEIHPKVETVNTEQWKFKIKKYDDDDTDNENTCYVRAWQNNDTHK